MRTSRDVSNVEMEVAPVEASHGDGAAACGSRPLKDPEAIEFSFALENDPALIPGVIGRINASAEQLGIFDDGTAQRVCLALHEAMINGIHHGNLELGSELRQEDEGAYLRLASRRCRMPRFRERRLHVFARLDLAGAVFVIRDEGPGFDPGRLPDPTDRACLDRPYGRGLLLIRAFMDEVSFVRTGNQITLYKRRTRPVPYGWRFPTA